MKSIQTLLITIFLLSFSGNAEAQSLKVLAGNTLMGTANGMLLGAGTMMMTNNDDLRPMRFGVGMGTLYGLGIGVYDLSYSELGSGYRIEGLFNSAGHSAFIVLLDTFYGGVTGGIVGMAIALMAEKPIIDGLQYGGGSGLWAGFTFGLADVFIFSDPIPAFVSNQGPGGTGLVQLTDGKTASLDLIQPAVFSVPNTLAGGNTVTGYRLGVDVARLSVRF